MWISGVSVCACKGSKRNQRLAELKRSGIRVGQSRVRLRQPQLAILRTCIGQKISKSPQWLDVLSPVLDTNYPRCL